METFGFIVFGSSLVLWGVCYICDVYQDYFCYYCKRNKNQLEENLIEVP